ncbi:MAG TPA: M28 family peptidase, partial [Anaerolineales bacterium]
MLPPHKTWSRCLILLSLLFLPLGIAASPQPATGKTENLAASLAADPLVQHMIAQVSAQQVMLYAGGLSGEWPVLVGGTPYTFTTRYSGAAIAIQKATQYAYEHFQTLGLNVNYQDYELGTLGLRRNVIAEQTGQTQPERVFLLTAHLDDMADSQNRLSLAPGADDNGSGSAAVLAAADILSQYSFGCTLRYVLFTGEEQGLYGSSVYAGSLSANKEDVEGVLNLDMIAYDSNAQPRLDLHTRAGIADDERIADLFAGVVNAYRIPLEPEIIPDSMPRSDHAYFWYNGFPAILAIEDRDDTTPYYHTIGDRYSTLNRAYLTHFVQAAVGTMAHLGCPLEGRIRGSVVEQAGAVPLEGAILLAQPGGSNGEGMAARSDSQGKFELLLSPGEYTFQAIAPSYMPQVQYPLTVTNG